MFRMAFDSQRDAQQIIDTLAMKPHPEGGWYAETYRAPSSPGSRSAVSTIYYLLREGERSHWHQVDATEIWLWHAGSPLELYLSFDGVEVEKILLGANLEAGERPQAIVPTRVLQSAQSLGAWSLVSCAVAPAFEFAGFSMAPANWAPGSINRTNQPA